MADTYRTWKPESDPGWKCDEHGLQILNDSMLGLVRQMAGGMRYRSMEEAAADFNARPDMEGFKLLESTSDINPCDRCEKRDRELAQILSESVKE